MVSVYFCYDRVDALLYIGCAGNLSERMYHHKRNSEWFPRMTRCVDKSYASRVVALSVESRAISLLKPVSNVIGQRDHSERLSESISLQGRSAQKAAGSKFGRAHTIRDSVKRIERLRQMDAAGQLRDPAATGGIMIPKAADLIDELNKSKNMGKKDKPINNPETVRRWAREGYPGLAAAADDK